MMKTISALIFLTTSIRSITAYCIYNQMSSGSMNADQVPGYDSTSNGAAAFYKRIGPGENKCCPYTVSDCCSNGDRNSTIEVNIMVADRYYFQQTAFQAGGFVIVSDPVSGSPLPVVNRYNWDKAWQGDWPGYDTAALHK